MVAGHFEIGRKEGANKFIVDDALVYEFHFIPNGINISRGQNKKPLKRTTAPSFHEIKGGSSARERLNLAIKETLETSVKKDGVPGDTFYADNK